MRRILSLSAFFLAVAAAVAAMTYKAVATSTNYEQKVSQKVETSDFPEVSAEAKTFTDFLMLSNGSSEMSNRNIKAYLTDKGDNKYDIQIEDIEFDKSYGPIHFFDVPATVEKGFIVFNATDVKVYMKGADNKAVAAGTMSVKGRCKDSKLYLSIEGSFSPMGDNVKFVYGDNNFVSTPPTEVSNATFKDKCSTGVMYGDGDVEQKQFAESKLSLVELSDGTYNVVFKDVVVGNANTSLGDVKIEGLEKSEAEDGRVLYSRDSEKKYTVTFENADASFNGKTFEVSTFKLTQYKKDGLTRLYGYALLLGTVGDKETIVQVLFGEDPDAAELSSFSYADEAHVTYSGTTTDFTDAKAELKEVMEDVYSLTFKDLTVGNMTIGDLTIENVTVEKNDETGLYELSTIDDTGVWSNVSSAATTYLGIEEDSESDISINKATVAGFDTDDTADDKLVVNLDINNFRDGKSVNLVYGEAVSTPDNTDKEGTVDIVEHGYAPAGQAWSKSHEIDWNTEYVKAEIDLSTCKNSAENVLGVARDASDWWADGFQFYYYPSTSMLEVDFITSDQSTLGKSNPVRYMQIPIPETKIATIEISKEEGVKVNGTQYNIINSGNGNTESDKDKAYSEFFARTELEFGGCQGNTMSNATYNYVHIEKLDATGINGVATTAAGNSIAGIYTLGGVKVNSLQNGVNIVRLANGKTVKIIKSNK